MSSFRNQVKGYVPSISRPSFKQPPAQFDLPEEQQPRQDRDISRDRNKELVYKTDLKLITPGTWGSFSQEAFVASLSKPHNAVDVYLSITNPLTVTARNGNLEVAAAIYARAGSSRSVVARGAYLVDLASPTSIDPYLYLCSARCSAEAFDISLRLGGAFTENSGSMVANLAVVGYKDGGANPKKPRTTLQAARAATVYSGTTVARAADLHGAIVTNSNASGMVLQFFDDSTTGDAPGTAAARLASTNALAQFYIPASTMVVLDFGEEPIPFLGGIVWQSSTTFGTMSAGSALAVQMRYA